MKHENSAILEELQNNHGILTELTPILPFDLQALFSCLAKNTVLTKLDLRFQSLQAEDVTALARALVQNTTLSMLQLKTANLSTADLQVLFTALAQNTGITELYLDRAKLEGVTMHALCRVITTNTTLTKLTLCIPDIEMKGMQILAKTLAINKSLTSFSLRGLQRSKNLDPDPDLLQLVVSALTQNTKLTWIDLCSNGLGAKEIAILTAWGSRNINSMTTLDLSFNQIGPESIQFLLGISLVSLTLLFSTIGKAGWQALAVALANCSLTALDVGGNNIEIEEMQLFAAALGKNTVLKSLAMGHCAIDDKCMQVAVAALAPNTTITTLDLEENFMNKKGGRALGILLDQNPAISTLHVSLTTTKKFFICLARNTSLTSLHLGHFTKVESLAAVLSKNIFLTNLKFYCRDNQLASRDIKAYILRNRVLRMFSLMGKNDSFYIKRT